MDWRKPKIVGDFGSMQHGVTLFVEENDPKGNFDEYRWKREFDSEIEKITLNLNQADDLDDAEPIRIKMDRNETIKQLKQAISDRTGISVDSFYLVRKSNSQEIKDINKTLVAMGFSNGVNLKIIKGQAKKEGVYDINVSIVKLVDEGDKDNVLFTQEPLGKLEVSGELTGFLLREAICCMYNGKHNKEISSDQFRVRCPQNDFGAVVNDLDILDDLNMFDDKDFFMHFN